jgi:hypothetical protein
LFILEYYLGRAFLYEMTSLISWTLIRTFDAPSTSGPGYGSSVALSDRHIGIGSWGNVYMYEYLTNGTILLTGEYSEPTSNFTQYGVSMGLDHDWLAIGASNTCKKSYFFF